MPQVDTGGGDNRDKDLLWLWATGRIRWNELDEDEKRFIRDRVVRYARNHPDQFSIEVQGATAQELIRSVNRGGGTTGSNTTEDRTDRDQDKDKQGGAKGLPKGYRVVKFGGRAYVVYDVKLGGGGALHLGWTLSQEEARKLGINWNGIKSITRAQFNRLSLGWGPVSDILSKGVKGEHPLQTYLRSEVYEVFGRKASWVKDREVLEIYLMAYLEGWSSEQIEYRLKRTDWYKSRTDAQRHWEMEVSRADKKAAINHLTNRLQNDIMDLYGPNFSWKDIGLTNKEIRTMAEEIASGAWGEPEMGYEQVLDDLRKAAEKVEGSAAWIDREQEIQAQNEFMNEPENMLWDITQQAIQWLGPQADGVPYLSEETLNKWSKDLVSGVKSEADWLGFLQQTAKTLYPWLPTGVSWSEAVDPYKALAERVWGKPVPYESPVLHKVAGVDTEGNPSGQMTDFLSYEKLLRQDEAFWTSEMGQDEGWNFLSRLDNIFHGVI